MGHWPTLLGRAAVSGTAASLSSSLALAVAATVEGRNALQPVNATSHWLNGPAAGTARRLDAVHTVIGYITHHAATVFWAVLFEAGRGRRHPVAPMSLVRDAVVVSAVAAGVDYIATPKRFTPGWELVLSKRSMAVGYAAMAAGLALAAFTVDRSNMRDRG